MDDNLFGNEFYDNTYNYPKCGFDSNMRIVPKNPPCTPYPTMPEVLLANQPRNIVEPKKVLTMDELFATGAIGNGINADLNFSIDQNTLICFMFFVVIIFLIMITKKLNELHTSILIINSGKANIGAK